ncbi:unnamed protein product [Heligmosomoides polygyrus]|uniref:PBPb domain-containing protein n=1 Tax=Heligmosomoides polygyrus TaxID=6339 RepID=A0A3P7XTS9_HELPZ|nr:unnamed protein product [Heligmosomoides polygyrus]
MTVRYNVTAVGYRRDFPYVNFDQCFSMSCPFPGAEVEFLRNSLRLFNATATVIPRSINSTQMIQMLHSGAADITFMSLIQSVDRMEKVDFTTPIGFLYPGYIVREASDLVTAIGLLLASILTVSVLLHFYSRALGSSQSSLSRFVFVTLQASRVQGWKCVVQEGSYTPFNYCKPHRCERLERLKDRFVNLKFDDSIVDILKLDRHFAFIALPNDIAPYPITVVDHRLSLLFVKDDVMAPQPLAYAVRNFQTIRKRYKSEYREYVDSHQRKDHTVLSLAHFQILFDVSIKAFGVAVIILVAGVFATPVLTRVFLSILIPLEGTETHSKRHEYSLVTFRVSDGFVSDKEFVSGEDSEAKRHKKTLRAGGWPQFTEQQRLR